MHVGIFKVIVLHTNKKTGFETPLTDTFVKQGRDDGSINGRKFSGGNGLYLHVRAAHHLFNPSFSPQGHCLLSCELHNSLEGSGNFQMLLAFPECITGVRF